MHKFILFIKEFHIYKKDDLLSAIASFSKKQFLIFIGLLAISFISIIVLFYKINNLFMSDVPVSGGTLTEGIVGSPTLINPVIASSEADKDLTSLVYSGLMRKTSEGKFIPDLAEPYEMSPDGTTYTFKLKDNVKFHNGTRITADDVIFTIEKIKDPRIKSSRKLEWEGINISKKDDYTVVFTLNQPYISFLDNTTIGILPSSIWGNISSNEFNISPFNTKAIGSGPYKIKSVLKNKDGIPTNYKLERFKNFSLGKPLIENININSYPNEKELLKALANNDIDQASGISPDNMSVFENNNYFINTTTLPKIFGIFFNNEKNKIFSDGDIINILNKAIDREDIINQVLNGYGSVIHNPIPENIFKDQSKNIFTKNTVDEINNILDKKGWVKSEDGIRVKSESTSKTITKKVGGKTIKQTVKETLTASRLSFSLITGDAPELQKATLLIKEQLLKIGVEVNIKVYETGQLNQIIKDREYEALFFGQSINHESGLYSFWHSSQRKDPGVNIAMYNNKKADDILESIQKILKTEDRIIKYEDLYKEFNINIPAILIYSPKYIQISSKNLNAIHLKNIVSPSDRFLSVYEWSTDTDKVWKIFTK